MRYTTLPDGYFNRQAIRPFAGALATHEGAAPKSRRVRPTEKARDCISLDWAKNTK